MMMASTRENEDGHRIIDSGNRSEKVKEEQIDESNGSITSGGTGTVNQSKFAHAGARGGGGGHSAGKGGNGSGGRSSPQGGGTAVIHVYVAGAVGAAGHRNTHRGAAGIGSRCQKDKLMIRVAAILTSILLYISM
ncbi:hypothetical protein L2E82_20609 [Cichorium intybus]|uniref:Uncharacterized protein n=1 Tax=Cichorium intybus TaxID=13427 RepID=A0ACB9DTT5_CICIN|nr:hypothetical protein L2E82_20609 [Cichorium intybus]